MSQSREVNKRISRRLVPLYISVFFQGFVLWYAIEKLFMQSIGFTSTTIGLAIALYSVAMLAVETPSGVLADRWSRKGVLILASICLSLSALIAALSNSVPVYLVSSIIWGVFFACYSGLYDSIVYDLVIEETGESTLFEKVYGRLLAVDSSALVLAGLVGGAVANYLSLRADYYWSIPLALIPILALLRFREPTLHKLEVVRSIKQQIAITIDAVLRNKGLIPILMALILRATLIFILFEFAQVWLLALDTPTKYYGIANAILLASIGVGAVSASHLSLGRSLRMAAFLGTMLTGLVALIGSRNLAVIVAAQLIVATCLEALSVILGRMLHDRLHASVRAGASAATSTISRALIIPLALVFGYISSVSSVFVAGYILVLLGVLLSAFMVFIARQDNGRGLETQSSLGLRNLEPK